MSQASGIPALHVCPLVVAVLIFSLAPRAEAQYTTGTIQETVFDPAGSIVSDAHVTLQNQETGEVKELQTGADGFFYFFAVLSGMYRLTAEAKGFSKAAANIAALAKQTTTQNLKLELAASSSQVVVAASGEAIDTSDPQLTTTYAARESDALPTNGRSFNAFSTLVSLAPGATPMYSPARGGGPVKVVGAQTGLISSDGGRPENTNVEFDFTNANDWEFGGVVVGTMQLALKLYW